MAIIWEHVVDGTVIGEIRREFDDKGGKKDTHHYTRGANGFAANIPKTLKPYPPFGLDSVVEFEGTILVVEGQKVQSAVASLGIQCVTSILGAVNAGQTNWERLRSASKIVLVPDNDQPGERYVSDVCGLLQPTSAEIFVARFPELPKKGDLVDWLQRQPELSAWDGYFPLADHPHHDALRERLLEEIGKRATLVPDDWRCLWPEPDEIESRLLPVGKFHSDMLPDKLRAWISDCAHRTESSQEFVAVGAIVAAGAAIGTRAAIRPGRYDDWAVVPNLWGAIIGDPSQGKSPAMRAAMAPLQQLEREASQDAQTRQRRYEAELASFTAKEAVLKEEMKAAAKGKSQTDMAVLEERLATLEPPAQPRGDRYLANDTTVEALIDLLSVNPRGILMFRDELSGLFSSFEKKGHEEDRSFMLESWSGEYVHRQDRRTVGTRIVDPCCVSLLGGIQSDLLKKSLVESSEKTNDGFFQRLQLLVYPDKNPPNLQIVDQRPNQEAQLRAFALYRELATGTLCDGPHRAIYHFSPEAQALHDNWLIELKGKYSKEEEESMIQQHLRKYASLMPSLALIFHMIDGKQDDPEVGYDCARLAAVWCGYLESHMRRMYGLLGSKTKTAECELADKIKRGKLGNRFTIRQVTHKGWKWLSYSDVVRQAADGLVEAGWLKMHRAERPGPGRPVIEYFVNPKILNSEEPILAILATGVHTA